MSSTTAFQRVPYVPYGAARQVWVCKDRRVLAHGPAGTGKTHGNLQKLHAAASKYPGMRGLIVRKVKADLAEVLKDFEEEILHDYRCASHERNKCNCIGGWIVMRGGENRSLRSMYKYPNGSEIVVGGMNKASRIMGPSYDMIVGIESTEFTEEDVDNLASRLRNFVMPYQQMILDCNPRQPQHHLWRGANAIPAKYTHFPSTHRDNPKYYDHEAGDWTPAGREYVLGTLNDMTGVRREWFLEGKWATADGTVYDFSEAMHVIKTGERPFVIPEDWRRIRSIDFGYSNPTVCQWWAIDPDGRMYLYRELYRTRRIVSEHAKEILRLSEGERIEATICDHDAGDRATLEAAGIPTIPGKKAVVPGIQKVMARLRVASDGRPRLFLIEGALVDPDRELDTKKLPRSTREEFDSYVYPTPKEGRELDEHPVKLHDHGMDALRMAVAYLDGLDDAVRVFPSADASNIRNGIESPIYIGSLRFTPGMSSTARDSYLRSRNVCGGWIDADSEAAGRGEGLWRLWTPLEKDQRGKYRPAQSSTYVIGCSTWIDAAGNHAVLSVSRRETREQVAETVLGGVEAMPDMLARMIALAGYWFGGHEGGGSAFVLWEGNTPGTAMGRELTRIGYPWMYYHAETDKRNAKPGDKYGWIPNPDRAQRLLLETRRAIATGEYRLRSDETAEACARLVMHDGGVGPWDTKDDADLRDGGVQRARAVALALSVAGMEMCGDIPPPKRIAPQGSVAYAIERAEAAEREANEGWWNRRRR